MLARLVGPLTFHATCCVCDASSEITEDEHADHWVSYAGTEAHALCAAAELLKNFEYLKGATPLIEAADVFSMLAGLLRARAAKERK